MQIQTTIRPNGIQTAKAAPQAAAADQQEQAEAPQDSFATTVKNEALGEARHLGNRFANIAGGAGGVIGASIGATAALTGGAIVGMAAGGAAAVPIGTLFSSGGFDAIKTGLSAIGTGGQIGIGLGLVTLAAEHSANLITKHAAVRLKKPKIFFGRAPRARSAQPLRR